MSSLMPSAKGLSRGGDLLQALVDAARTIEASQTASECARRVAAALAHLGFEVALWAQTTAFDEQWVPTRSESLQSQLRALARGSEGHFVADLALPDVPRAAAVLPVLIRRENAGWLLVMHDELVAGDVAALQLFALHLGARFEAIFDAARLSYFTAQLDAVHDLAVAATLGDGAALLHRGMEAACRLTGSQAGSIHRYDASSGVYVQVGEAFGCPAELAQRYRRFSRQESLSLLQHPESLNLSQLGAEADLVRSHGFLHLALIPLMIEGRPAGVLTLARAHDAAYGAAELRSAEIFGVQIISQLERVRLYDEANRLYGELKSSYDDLARTQQGMVRHERLAALGELAAVMAHEVRNPLGVIFNSLTTLKRLLKPTGDAEMLLTMVGEEADRLNRIVSDLLDFVRPYEVLKKLMAVQTVIEGAIDAATQSGLPGNVKVVSKFAAHLEPFPLDAHLLKQVLVNLIVNAAQAMPWGGTITIKVGMEVTGGHRWLCMSVCDQGVGLSPGSAEKIFQPFFTTKATGTGLGLAVVKRIVDAHLGQVTVQANESGEGTTFTVRFPHSMDSRSEALAPQRML